MGYYCEAFQEYLEKGEQIKWVGRAQPFRLAEEENKKNLYCRWILTTVISAILIVICIVLTEAGKGFLFSIVFPAVIIVTAICVILKPAFDAYVLRNKRTYIVTNQRVVLLEARDFYYSLPLEKIDEVRFVHRKNGCADVFFGKPAIQKPYAKARKLAIVPIERPNGPMGVIIGAVFYNAADTEQIKTLLAPGTAISDV